MAQFLSLWDVEKGNVLSFSYAMRFGAKADGVADDSAACQAAVNDAYQRGVPVFFHPGTYSAATLTNANNVPLIGVGASFTGNTLAITDFSTVFRRNQSAAAVAVATSGTIATAALVESRVNPASAVTGVILAAGTYGGQEVWVVNEAAVGNTVTFAAAGTSNVADGVSDEINGGQARKFVWDSSTVLWYPALTSSPVQSATSPAIASAGTITANGISVARVTPAAAVTGIILQAGLFPGQRVTVINEGAAASTLTFAASGTSNVADGVSDVLLGATSRDYVWDSSTALWYPTVQSSVQSATAVATATAGTIATNGLNVSRTNPASAITGVILAAGLFAGQEVTVVNEATLASSITFAVSGTSNVADGAGDVILGGTAKKFTWDSGTSLWYPTTSSLVQSATSPAIASSGTITTAATSVARVTPAAAVTGIIMAVGTYGGQSIWVINEGAATSTLAFAASGTSNVADGINDIIPGATARNYIWDTSTSLWYPAYQSTVQSPTAVATATSGTIATAGLSSSRVNPAGAITAVVLAPGTYGGQEVWVVNEATAANSVTFAASGTSNVADGVSDVIAGVTARKFVWDSGTSLWYKAT